MIDPASEKGRHVEGRLRTDTIVWLTTVRADGQPQSSPVWFVWDGETILLYSKPSSGKIPNIRSNPKVSLHLGDQSGSDVISMEGVASVDDLAPPVHELSQYVEKYRGLIAELGTEPEPFARDYSVPIRVRITRTRHPY
jgi:PPOX class probable F420-dependent enzyme